MSSENQDLSKIIGEIRREILLFADSYGKAVKSGANVAVQKIKKTGGKLEKPADIPTGNMLSALKSGVKYAGEQMLNSGLEYYLKQRSKKK